MTFVQRMVTQRDREAILDYFCVSKELKKFVVDVKVKRYVEIGSYHHLVFMKMDKGRMGVKGKKL
jgi:preprotein translocase subunit Sec63